MTSRPVTSRPVTSRFVALGVEPQVRDRLAAALAPVRAAHPDLAWTDPAGWHITLAFLGDLADAEARAVAPAIDGPLAASSGLRERPRWLELGSATAFGDRVLVTEVDDHPSGSVASLGARLQASLADAGVPVHRRPVRAHVTLARARRRGPVIDARLVAATDERLVAGRWEPTVVGLWSSHPRPNGPARYDVDQQVTLVR